MKFMCARCPATFQNLKQLVGHHHWAHERITVGAGVDKR